MSTLKATNIQNASAASPAIVLAADGSATAQLSSLNGGPLAGARNRIINGGMDIWQRGTSTTTAGNTYLADRWQSAFSTGGTVSQETSSLPTGSRFAWKYVASATNSFMQMGQQIEFVNCLDLQNITVAISFMARAVTSNAGSTALTVRTRTIAGVDGTCVFAGSNSDTAITLTTAWTRFTVTRTLPASFGALSLEFALGSHVSGDGIMLSQVQLEPGSVATPFERRSYGQELALCQRYFEVCNYSWGALYATTAGLSAANFAVTKRTNPNVTLAGAALNVNVLSLGNKATTGTSVQSISTTGVAALYTGMNTTGMVIGLPIESSNAITASAEL